MYALRLGFDVYGFIISICPRFVRDKVTEYQSAPNGQDLHSLRRKKSAPGHSGPAQFVAAAGRQGDQHRVEQAEHTVGQSQSTGEQLGRQQDPAAVR